MDNFTHGLFPDHSRPASSCLPTGTTFISVCVYMHMCGCVVPPSSAQGVKGYLGNT